MQFAPALRFRGLAEASPLPLREGPLRSELRGRVYDVRGWMRWGDRRKLSYLRNLAETYGRDPQLRQFVIQRVLVGVPDRAYEQQAAGLLRWVQNNVRYVNEPDEQIQSPWQTIKLGYGDCDDSSVLLAAMAESVALPWRFALAGVDRKRGTRVRHIEGERLPFNVEFGHIYVMLGDRPFRPSRWMAAEPTVKGAGLGRDIAMTTGVMPEMMSPVPGAKAGFGLGAPYGATSFEVDDRIERAEHPIIRLGRMLPWQDVAVSVVASLLVAWLLERRRR